MLGYYIRQRSSTELAECYVFIPVCLLVCVFVCLLAGLLKNIWTDLNEILWEGS